MQTEVRIINSIELNVNCETCPVCGEYQERIVDTGEYIKGHECGH